MGNEDNERIIRRIIRDRQIIRYPNQDYSVREFVEDVKRRWHRRTLELQTLDNAADLAKSFSPLRFQMPNTFLLNSLHLSGGLLDPLCFV